MPLPSTAARAPLSRERVLAAAIALADAGGIEALTMRRLGQELGVEAMSLYRHVANTDDLLDELILTIAPALVGSGPALADGVFPLRRFTLTRMEPFGDDGVRLHYDRTREET